MLFYKHTLYKLADLNFLPSERYYLSENSIRVVNSKTVLKFKWIVLKITKLR